MLSIIAKTPNFRLILLAYLHLIVLSCSPPTSYHSPEEEPNSAPHVILNSIPEKWEIGDTIEIRLHTEYNQEEVYLGLPEVSSKWDIDFSHISTIESGFSFNLATDSFAYRDSSYFRFILASYFRNLARKESYMVDERYDIEKDENGLYYFVRAPEYYNIDTSKTYILD